MGPASGWRRRPLVLVLVLVFGDVAECAKCPAPTASAGDPSLRLDTNIALIGDEKREFMKSAATVMASVLKQSADKIAVCVNDQLAIMWHGTDEPAAMGCVYSVGEVNQFNNVAITSGLSALLFNYGIKPERVHLNFFDVPEGNCGYYGQNQGEVTPVTAPPQRITTPPSSVTAPVAVAAAAAAQEECVKVCVRETVTKRVVPPIDEISLPVIKYACKRRCGEKQTANAVEKVAENIQKMEEILEHIHSEHLMGEEEESEVVAAPPVTVMLDSAIEQQLLKKRDKKTLKEAMKLAKKEEKKRLKAELCKVVDAQVDAQLEVGAEGGKKKKKKKQRAMRMLQSGMFEAAQSLDMELANQELANQELANQERDEDTWYEDWGDRLECWFIALPRIDQTFLGSCLGALGLHLGSRLRGGAPPTPTAGCEALEQRVDELQLPEFPELDGFDFLLPAIPRLVPSWEHLQALADEFSPVARGGDGGAAPQRVASELGVPLLAGGAGGALLAIGYISMKSVCRVGRPMLRRRAGISA